jgi:hypothetical protein
MNHDIFRIIRIANSVSGETKGEIAKLFIDTKLAAWIDEGTSLLVHSTAAASLRLLIGPPNTEILTIS